MSVAIIPSFIKPAELIVFLEVDSNEIIRLTKDVEHISNFPYSYEYHLTLGWFTEENPDQLRILGGHVVNCVKEQILGFVTNVLNDDVELFRIIIDGVGRQPDSRGGGFYFQPTAYSTQQALIIHKGLTSLLSMNQISSSELITDYQPHITFTPQITREIINEQRGNTVLQAINNKITGQNGELSGTVILKPLAVRAILKYQNMLGNEHRETWDCKVDLD